MRHKPYLVLILACIVGAASTGCAPKLGDGCNTSTDCSVRGDRICDRAQPGGYCTIANCKPGDCGDEGICVRFNPDEPRLSTTYCMAKCSNNDDCDRDRYACRSAQQLNNANFEAGESRAIAETLEGRSGAKFCAVKADPAPPQ